MSRTYKSFNSAYFKSQKPLNQTITDLIYVRRVSKKNELANAALEYRTFLFACQNGTYKFVSDRSDDITLMWFGAKAYDKWDRSNADIMQYFYGDNRRKVVTRTIRAGTYYPIRVMWGNTGGAAALSLKIYAPDGRQLFGFGHNGGSYLTTEACDGSYRKHPPFGHER
ncbi:GLEYA adhesin domain protein [Metarhizium rileyi]|uniref:GLEYA adhesin domain protein n=1 Tax=Metarhizium rileyi (strain RCEF 4871) TaxID=1649241 RepID=A0A162J4L4_METRR|nr:GLEYA adhesin domain protein [Metarhizium rileyi RCEF 4871]